MLTRLEKILLFLVVLFLPTQLGKHFWPDFVFIYSLKIDYLSPTIYFWDILVVGLLVVWILQKPKINKLALNLFLFFLLTQVLSLFGAGNLGAGLVRLEQYTLAGLFGVYIASIKIATTKYISLPLALAIFGEAILAILQFIKGGTLGFWILGERTFTISTPGIAKFDFYGREFLRPYATFPHPNVLAGYMLISVVILRNLSVIARRESSTDAAIYRTGKIASPLRGLAMTIIKASALLAGLTIFLTMSRTAILAGFMTLVILLKRKWIISITVIALILSPILFTRFSSLFNFDNLTLLRREELLGSAWQIFLQQPIFGVGLNNFITVQAADLSIGPSRFLQPVHNIFLLVLSETGLMGLIGLMCLIGLPILRLIKLNPKPSPLNPILPWLIILFLGLFDHYFLTLPQGYRLLFLVWGLSLSIK